MNRSGLKILIVEDDFIIAENLKENLNELGYGEVFHGSNSNEGQYLFETHHPDLCIVDIQLNGSQLDGIEMVMNKKMGELIPIIYLTSFSDEDIRERAKKTNPASYLIKPTNQTQIDVAIDIALSNFYSKSDKIKSQYCPMYSGNGFIFLKVKNKDLERYEKYYLKDIIYLKAEGSYTHIYIGNKSPLVSMNLNKTLKSLNNPNLIRCHRSFAVNLEHVHSIDSSNLYLVNGEVVVKAPFGEQYKMEVLNFLPRL